MNTINTQFTSKQRGVFIWLSFSALLITAFLLSSSTVLASPVCEDNGAPVPVIDQSNPKIGINETITLSAAGSHDPDGDSLNYLWSINYLGIEQNGETFEFTPPNKGFFTVTLVAGDQCGNWNVTWTTIEVGSPDHCSVGNSTPIPVIEPQFSTTILGNTVHFDSNQSSDPDGDNLSFLWAVNQLGIEHAQSTFDFTPPDAGQYVVTLVAGDQCGAWDVAFTVINVEQNINQCLDNSQPESVITPDSPNIKLGETVHFNSSQSSDPEGDELTFQWLVDGSEVSTEPNFNFTPTAVGLYEVTLQTLDQCSEDIVSTTVTVTESSQGNTPPQFLPRVYKTLPTANTLFDGSGIPLFVFAIEAPTDHAVAFYKATVELERDDVLVSNLELIEEMGTNREVNLTQDSPRQLDEIVVPHVGNSGTDRINILFDVSTDGQGDIRTISAGTTKRYTLIGSVHNSNSNSALRVRLLSDEAYPARYPNVASGIDADSNDNFIWTDLSFGAATSGAINMSDWFNGYNVFDTTDYEMFTRQTKADLVVNDIEFKESHEGLNNVITAEVCNQGNRFVDEYYTEFTIDGVSQYAYFDDYHFHSFCKTLYVELNSFGLSLPAGSYPITVTADKGFDQVTDNLIDEHEENNNSLTRSLLIGEGVTGKPDLIVSSFEVTSFSPLKLNGVITNQGSEEVYINKQFGSDYLRIPVSVVELGTKSDGIFGSKLPVTRDDEYLSPGESMDITLEDNTANLLAGSTYTVQVTVDDTNNVEELNETNNTLSQQIFIEPKPDLVVESLWYDDDYPGIGEVLLASVCNRGHADAHFEQMYTEFTLLSTKKVVAFGGGTEDKLAINECFEAFMRLNKIAPGLTPDDYEVTVEADRNSAGSLNNIIIESDETNNSLSETIFIGEEPIVAAVPASQTSSSGSSGYVSTLNVIDNQDGVGGPEVEIGLGNQEESEVNEFLNDKRSLGLRYLRLSKAIKQHGDRDKDRLPDSWELELGTDPNNPDTDNDGYRDGIELLFGYTPLGEGKIEL